MIQPAEMRRSTAGSPWFADCPGWNMADQFHIYILSRIRYGFHRLGRAPSQGVIMREEGKTRCVDCAPPWMPAFPTGFPASKYLVSRISFHAPCITLHIECIDLHAPMGLGIILLHGRPGEDHTLLARPLPLVDGEVHSAPTAAGGFSEGLPGLRRSWPLSWLPCWSKYWRLRSNSWRRRCTRRACRPGSP